MSDDQFYQRDLDIAVTFLQGRKTDKTPEKLAVLIARVRAEGHKEGYDLCRDNDDEG